MSRLDTAAEQIEAALQAPADERAYHVRQACQVLPAEHPARASLEAALDADHAADVDGLLRAAYGALPPGRDRDDDPRADGGQATRREVLASAAGIGVAGVASDLNQHSGADDGRVLVKDDGDAIPAPFDALPVLEAPPDKLRRIAEVNLPPWAIPETGPIPDPRHTRTVERPITVPAWALEATRWRLSHADPADVDRVKVGELLVEYVQLREQFRTPDGRNAVDVLLDEVTHGDV